MKRERRKNKKENQNNGERERERERERTKIDRRTKVKEKCRSSVRSTFTVVQRENFFFILSLSLPCPSNLRRLVGLGPGKVFCVRGEGKERGEKFFFLLNCVGLAHPQFKTESTKKREKERESRVVLKKRSFF